MAFNLAKFFKKKSKDTLIFQVSEEFIEVAAVRRVEGEEVNVDGLCYTELLYSQRLPRAVVQGAEQKRVLDDLALNLGQLADDAVVAKELLESGFVVGEVQVVCILVEPLSIEARTTYSVKLKQSKKITMKILSSVVARGAVTLDELKDAPTEYAVYAEELESVALNGYKTRRPLDKEASLVEVTTVKKLTTPERWSAVGGVLERTFHRELWYMHMPETVLLDSPELCDKIYTGNELQEIGRAIL